MCWGTNGWPPIYGDMLSKEELMATVIENVLSRAQIPFRNEPLANFSQGAIERAQIEALEQVKHELGCTYPLIIRGQKITGDATFASVNPAQPDQVVGRFVRATVEQAQEAVLAATETFETWKRVPAQERASYLFAAADLLRQRRYLMNAWMIYEVSKTWVEADADTAEAIDFLEFYAHEILRLSEKQPLTLIEGEDNELVYIPLGVGVVIPPWNFPCAIALGMTSAALVAGNTVVLKPASTAPTVAYQFVRMLEEVGLPAGVVNFLPGSGAVVGNALVDNPLIRFVAFTGSRDVGLSIYERAARHHPGQIWLKRTILEMGGKDGTVVDETADLEAASTAIVSAAFGFQGQKCSA